MSKVVLFYTLIMSPYGFSSAWPPVSALVTTGIYACMNKTMLQPVHCK